MSTHRPYTGPTAMRIVGDKLHIDGYPDADRVVCWEAPIAKRLADLRMHQATVDFCEKAMQEFAKTPEGARTAAEAILIGVVASYFSCFGDNQASLTLSVNRVFKGREDAKMAFEHWKAIRNKVLIHNESSINFMVTGIALTREGDVEDILSLMINPSIMDDQQNLQNLYELIAYTQRFLQQEITELLARAFNEAMSMTRDSRLGLGNVTYVVADVSNPRFTRKR